MSTQTQPEPRTRYICINGHNEATHGDQIDTGNPDGPHECAVPDCSAEAEPMRDSLDEWNDMMQTRELNRHLERRLATVNEQIEREARRLWDKMAELRLRLADNPGSRRRDINSLGEVQSAGIDIDRLCAVRQELLDLLDGLDYPQTTLTKTRLRDPGTKPKEHPMIDTKAQSYEDQANDFETLADSLGLENYWTSPADWPAYLEIEAGPDRHYNDGRLARLRLVAHGGDPEAGLKIIGLTGNEVVCFEATLSLGTPRGAISHLAEALLGKLLDAKIEANG